LATANRTIKLADEVWIATALLHRRHPELADFTIKEIEQRARREAIAGEPRKGLYPHILLHCVANRRPNPGRYRMLFATGRTTRRLFREGDPYDPGREGAKIVPAREDVPRKYHELLDWYASGAARSRAKARSSDPLDRLRGLGRQLWSNEDADVYVDGLRRGWS